MENLKTLPEHHAICFETNDRVKTQKQIREILDRDKIYCEIIDRKILDIDSAREVSSWNEREIGRKKTMIISFHTAMPQAQNALLKVLEEPRNNTQFILITTNASNLLPTVKSRLLMMSDSSFYTDASEIAIFLDSIPAERMELKFINQMINEKDSDGRKDREKTQAFFSKLLETLSSEKIDRNILREIADCALYGNDTSSSTKMLMEYVSLRLPRIALKDNMTENRL